MQCIALCAEKLTGPPLGSARPGAVARSTSPVGPAMPPIASDTRRCRCRSSSRKGFVGVAPGRPWARPWEVEGSSDDAASLVASPVASVASSEGALSPSPPALPSSPALAPASSPSSSLTMAFRFRFLHAGCLQALKQHRLATRMMR